MTSAPGGQPREPQAAMSVSVTLAELADVAFRTPNGGSVNAGALHLLLRGLLEHLRLQDASTQLSEDERGLLEPGAGAGGRPRAVVLQAEGRPGSPRGSPSTTEPPTPRQDTDRTGTDACQTTQLTKRMEAIEEGMTKVSSHPWECAHLQRGARLLAWPCAGHHPALHGVLPYTGMCPCGASPMQGLVHGDLCCPKTGEPGKV